MKVIPFIADNPAAALTQIHERLGPDAVVLSIRPLPTRGLARIWRRSRSVEVLACVPDPGDPSDPTLHQNSRVPENNFAFPGRFPSSTAVAPALHADDGRPHVFIGPPGVGKTTLLCKWLTFSVLNENRAARVWRLDGDVANTAEFLNIYGEMLDVSVERFWVAAPPPSNLLLVDLPGVQHNNPEALRALRDQLAALPRPRIHLVLNAAYETSILASQFNAFAPFLPEDLSFCHLDEEKRQGKLLDFVSGTNCCLRFLSTGQKIPGDFLIADAPTEHSGVYPLNASFEVSEAPLAKVVLNAA